MAETTPSGVGPDPPHDPAEATLVFREQPDGRKIARLPGGKVVLVDLAQIDRVQDGETWLVRLRHRETFAIAEPVERQPAATEPPSAGTAIAAAFRSARAAAPARSEAATAAVTPDDAAPAIAPVPIDISKLVRPSDRVALFVDGANTDGAARSAGYFIDFRKAREFFAGEGRFYAAFYYVADFTASDPLQQRFFDLLSHAGYIVRRRPVKVIEDPETGERLIKGNLDTEIVLDLLNTVDNYDVAFLFSGDSDFERAVELLRSRGRRVYVVSARGPLSRELAYVADKPIVYLENVRAAIARPGHTPRAR